jgi:hypothetical protein
VEFKHANISALLAGQGWQHRVTLVMLPYHPGR